MKGVLVSTVDKAKNKAQEAKGHVKDAAGRATNDKSLEAEGKADKVAGNLKQAGEKVKDALKSRRFSPTNGVAGYAELVSRRLFRVRYSVVDGQPPMEGLVVMSLATSRELGHLPVSGHPSLGMYETCPRLPALCWMRKERQPK
jgi:uncharacterized protein YjbJ (UPF0337 family)